MNQRILILGGTGFIGSSLSQYLKAGNETRIYSPSAQQIDPISGVSGYDGFIEDFSSLEPHLEWATIIIHLVSTSNPKSSLKNPFNDAKSNLLPLISILEYLKNHTDKKLVFCSSGGAVYGMGNGRVFSESDPKAPISSYGIVKSTMEEYIDYYQRLYGVNALVIRPSNIYGAKSRSLGKQGLISTLVEHTLVGKTTALWVPLTTSKDYLYIVDFVKAVKMLIESDAIGMFNIASGHNCTIADLLQVVEKVLRIKPKIRTEIGDFSKIDSPVKLDIQKLQMLTNWKPETSLLEGVEMVANEFKIQHGDI
ncbi:NAD-dependent epimerase/dehydratase family protein [Echinicola soli]|uniref:NAD-dependent epimerase/dehydratase family protein n=1 Tax=Echinicola soli TaxID=2591634 RepID=A0A514CJ01_9BACT|nr:NAD-dependent epimerase/dehydratase family protein [Echinicola soli]QDH79803.1 NAD-dependent epimerase/dehydratase family protein [Echinicola soli]